MNNNGNYSASDLEGMGQGGYPYFAYAAVYLPYNYSRDGKPFKVMYLSHGAGNPASEHSWTGKGVIQNQMDNMIASGGSEPFVVVSIDNYATGWNGDNFLNVLVPAIEAKYNVSRDPADRAVVGFSRGAYFTHDVMKTGPDFADSYGLFSAYLPDSTMAADYTALSGKSIYIGVGIFDEYYWGTLNIQKALAKDGVSFSSHLLNAGHDWYVWRLLYNDLVSKILWK
ncbi:hypothetical protein PM3016_2219 [Paenibacillus mucilaginosus 3016]|uniref:Esterase n=1 Tax=Paenibacillus mucilaginosus 3016 TaxID=1116391 RepID=H6NHB2_9BACL|nr:alpha/beta hydrolase-fold protein [Paenibacillus mucilaginosus]AFC29107.1 hypothetical protein PM3016_2219 [Paenibacillus mucilaginosus 3016]WFA17848.1 hypothetical protein ERY13_11455 [Paenibacillus mucilaginosus]